MLKRRNAKKLARAAVSFHGRKQLLAMRKAKVRDALVVAVVVRRRMLAVVAAA